jgi:hypothetical protein
MKIHSQKRGSSHSYGIPQPAVEIHSQNGFAHSYGKTELLSALSEPLSEVVCTPQLPEWN